MGSRPAHPNQHGVACPWGRAAPTLPAAPPAHSHLSHEAALSHSGPDSHSLVHRGPRSLRPGSLRLRSRPPPHAARRPRPLAPTPPLVHTGLTPLSRAPPARPLRGGQLRPREEEAPAPGRGARALPRPAAAGLTFMSRRPAGPPSRAAGRRSPAPPEVPPQDARALRRCATPVPRRHRHAGHAGAGPRGRSLNWAGPDAGLGAGRRGKSRGEGRGLAWTRGVVKWAGPRSWAVHGPRVLCGVVSAPLPVVSRVAARGRGSGGRGGPLVGTAACPGGGPLASAAHALPRSLCALCDDSAAARCDHQGAPEAPDPQPGVGAWRRGPRRTGLTGFHDLLSWTRESPLQAFLLPFWWPPPSLACLHRPPHLPAGVPLSPRLQSSSRSWWCPHAAWSRDTKPHMRCLCACLQEQRHHLAGAKRTSLSQLPEGGVRPGVAGTRPWPAVLLT